MAGFVVEVGVIADHRRRTGAGLGAAGPGVAAGRGQGVDLDAVDGGVAVVAGNVVNHGRDEHGVAGLDRVFLAVGHQRSAALDDIDLVLPLMDVVRAGSARLDNRVGRGDEVGVVVDADQAGDRPFRIILDVVDDGFHPGRSMVASRSERPPDAGGQSVGAGLAGCQGSSDPAQG